MRIIILVTVLLVNLLLSAPLGALQKPTPFLFKVSMEITIDGEVVGSPSVIIESGASAVVTSTRENGYSLKATLGSTGGLATASIPLTTELYRNAGGRWTKMGEPTIFVAPGRDASITMERPGQPTARLAVKIEPTTAAQFSSAPSFGKNQCTKAKLAMWGKSMQRPVAKFTLVSAQRFPPEPGQRCCTVCQGVRCCSNGPICCSDRTLCGTASCCA